MATRHPLFPLPTLLLYPGAMAPLHLYEPRYRRLMQDLLARGGEEMVVGTLLPGWEDEYFGNPPAAAIAGLGRILEQRQDAEGNYDLLLQGIGRVRLLDEELAEVPAGELPYRLVTVEDLEEQEVTAAAAPGVHAALLAQLEYLVAEVPAELHGASINRLADLLLVHTAMPMEQRLELFSTLEARSRAEHLLSLLENRRREGGEETPEEPTWN